MEKPELMTKGEVASFARVEERAINRWMSRGWIHFVRLPNGRVRFKRSEVLRAMEGDQDARHHHREKNDTSIG